MSTIFFNGKVYTGELPFASAFAVDNGHFTAVGTDEDVLAGRKSSDLLIDLSCRFVCAGFNDSHMHLVNFGQTLSAAPLAKHTDSLSAVIDCMKAHLAMNPPKAGQWLTGRGWNQDYFTDVKRMPDRFDLDAVSTEIPIVITRTCGHCCAANSKALALAGIDGSTISPEGGSIGMKDGEPDGLLFDNAMDMLLGKMPLPDKEMLESMIRLACAELNRYGITSVQTDDYCVFREIPPVTFNEAYRELVAKGELTVRVNEQCNFTSEDELSAFINAGNVTGKGDEMFRIGPLKMLGDGALGSRTAHLSKPYLDDSNNCGFSLFSPEHMKNMVALANRNGMQTAIHAIGD
ncbi:MAG: amidohydrolase family protein, partial [Clostridia bacterium]|nr:amidohydrolase family protein [Clostridia bacterium]